MNNANKQAVALKDTVARVSYFRDDARFGRTTTLVVKQTGEKLGVFMGSATRSDCYASYLKTR